MMIMCNVAGWVRERNIGTLGEKQRVCSPGEITCTPKLGTWNLELKNLDAIPIPDRVTMYVITKYICNVSRLGTEKKKRRFKVR